ncbi:hypothetical protein [Lactococcus protaetiae]|nr:hypothetical protein [Lactococcus protaetiae]MCL2114561.1 hypothetical protein [Streptococcaceae bacterium]
MKIIEASQSVKSDKKNFVEKTFGKNIKIPAFLEMVIHYTLHFRLN